jgi:hypothetical protein
MNCALRRRSGLPAKKTPVQRRIHAPERPWEEAYMIAQLKTLGTLTIATALAIGAYSILRVPPESPGEAQNPMPPESAADSASPIIIKFSTAGRGLLRLEIPRNADPALVQSQNLRRDLKVYLPKGTSWYYEDDADPGQPE